MELHEFIRETLKDIALGIHEGNLETVKALDNKQIHGPFRFTYSSGSLKSGHVEFDIAITVAEDKGLKGGGKIGVAALGIGAEASSKSTTENVSRIKFLVETTYSID